MYSYCRCRSVLGTPYSVLENSTTPTLKTTTSRCTRTQPGCFGALGALSFPIQAWFWAQFVGEHGHTSTPKHGTPSQNILVQKNTTKPSHTPTPGNSTLAQWLDFGLPGPRALKKNPLKKMNRKPRWMGEPSRQGSAKAVNSSQTGRATHPPVVGSVPNCLGNLRVS